MPQKAVDPSPSQFWKQAVQVALVLTAIGVVVALLGKLIVGGIIVLLGAVFGLSSQVARNNKVE